MRLLLERVRTWVADNRYKDLPGIRVVHGKQGLVVRHPDPGRLVAWTAAGWNSIPAQREVAEAVVEHGELIFVPHQGAQKDLHYEKILPTWRDRFAGSMASLVAFLIRA